MVGAIVHCLFVFVQIEFKLSQSQRNFELCLGVSMAASTFDRSRSTVGRRTWFDCWGTNAGAGAKMAFKRSCMRMRHVDSRACVPARQRRTACFLVPSFSHHFCYMRRLCATNNQRPPHKRTSARAKYATLEARSHSVTPPSRYYHHSRAVSRPRRNMSPDQEIVGQGAASHAPGRAQPPGAHEGALSSSRPLPRCL